MNLKNVKHRKIVHKIFFKYIPDKNKINLGFSSLKAQNYYENVENMESLVEQMKYLPKNIQNLNFNLRHENLGENSDNFVWLTEGIR